MKRHVSEVVPERRFQKALARYLEEQGFEVRLEVRVPTGRLDILAIRDGKAMLIETKVQKPEAGIDQLYRYHPYTGGTMVLAVPDTLATRHLSNLCLVNEVRLLSVPLFEEVAA